MPNSPGISRFISKGAKVTPLPAEEPLLELVFAGLMRVNQDFREVTRMFERSQVRVIVHDHGTGPFAGRDIRIKNNYIAQ